MAKKSSKTKKEQEQQERQPKQQIVTPKIFHNQQRIEGEKRRDKLKLIAKIYRQFSRRKFTKYKQQYPRLKQSQLIFKIIREWQSLTQAQRLALEGSFTDTGGASYLKDSSGSKSKSLSSKSKEEAKSEEVSPQEESGPPAQKIVGGRKEKKPSPKVRVFVEKAKPIQKRLSQELEGDGKREDNSGSSSVSIALKGSRRIKKVSADRELHKQKNKRSDYFAFFKYYHSRLTCEHPRWSSGQIGTIIKLLWRKRNIGINKSKKVFSCKPVSGKVLYRREKELAGFHKKEIGDMWRKLPFESKAYWGKKGRGTSKYSCIPIQSLKKLHRTMKSGWKEASENKGNGYVWMNSVINKL